MKLIKIAMALFLLQLVLACSSLSGKGAFVSSEKSTSSESLINSMKVFIDASAIGTAGATIKNIAQSHSEASQSLVNSFNTKMNAAGVNALVKPFGTVTYTVTTDGPKTTTTLRSQGVATDKMIAGESSNSQPILIVRIGSSQAINNLWNGMVGWRLELIDPNVWTNTNKTTIWKGETKLMQFGPTFCSLDAYKSCSDKLTEIVIAQLRTEKLIK